MAKFLFLSIYKNITNCCQWYSIYNPRISLFGGEEEEVSESFAGVDKGFKKTIEQLHKFKDIKGINKVIADMASQGKKYAGSKFMLNHLETKAAKYIENIQEFEKIVREGENFSADVLIKIGDDFFHLEYKSWTKSSCYKYFKGEQFLKQFKSYIKTGKFEYIFDKSKLSGKVKNPENFIKKQFQKVFKDNADEIWDLNKDMCKTLKKGSKKIKTKTEFKKFIETDNFLNQISGYVKVE